MLSSLWEELNDCDYIISDLIKVWLTVQYVYESKDTKLKWSLSKPFQPKLL